jgi:hypothetical protein
MEGPGRAGIGRQTTTIRAWWTRMVVAERGERAWEARTPREGQQLRDPQDPRGRPRSQGSSTESITWMMPLLVRMSVATIREEFT